MAYKFEEELREKAQLFVKTLLQAGIPVEPNPAMFRDYMVKLTVKSTGYISIYYSPKQASFSLKLHELRDSQLASQIEACWNGEDAQTGEISSNQGYRAYVDGSYINGFVGYGAVILDQEREIIRFSGSVEDHVEQRQVVGELQATMQVLSWCEENSIANIEVFYDYEGIQKWATGEWRANNVATQHYQQMVQTSSVQVGWHKVKSHTGIRWNDVVDELAKQGALAQSSDTAQPEDVLVTLEQKALGFVVFLANQNVEAKHTQIYNEQYARIVIEGGYFDLYNTRKRPMSPYLHNFKDAVFQKRIEQLWQQFHLGVAEQSAATEATGFEEVEYYLSILSPYRHLAFDFSALANALETALGHDSKIELPVDNYDELEHIYRQLRLNND